MKKKGHPPYQDVLFVDSSTGYKFVCGSTLQPSQTEVFEGKTYPVYPLAVSSASHPFFTGSSQLIDTEGRVDKFTKRYQAKKAESLAQLKKEEEVKKKEKAKPTKAKAKKKEK
jgi:large subunit ribosomal protein L31